MTEAELLTEVLKLAKKHHLLAFHCSDSRYTRGDAGFPDLVCAGSAETIFVELKSEYGAMRKGQPDWRWRLLSSGQTHYIWKPSDLASGVIQSVLSRLHEGSEDATS